MTAPGWSVLVGAAALLAGCGDTPASGDEPAHAEPGETANAHGDAHDHDHGHDDAHEHPETPGEGHGHAEAAGGVQFSEGNGLALPPEVKQALALTLAEAKVRPLADTIHLMAQVFATVPRVLASATAPADHADHYREHAFTGAKLVRIDPSATGTTRLVDLIIEIERAPAPALGEFIELEFAAEPITALTVPTAALLDAATGTFVYVEQGAFFLRTPVKVGARSPDWVEIVDGLDEGDVVVAAAVEHLWLTELRLTKGGGHSH